MGVDDIDLVQRGRGYWKGFGVQVVFGEELAELGPPVVILGDSDKEQLVLSVSEFDTEDGFDLLLLA